MADLLTLYNSKNMFLTRLEEMEKNGKKLYNTNDTYKSIANLMEHPEFRKFFDKHFSNWDDIKTILMFLKLYQEIDTILPVNLNGYQKIFILDSLIKTTKTRREICKKFINNIKTDIYNNNNNNNIPKNTLTVNHNKQIH